MKTRIAKIKITASMPRSTADV